MKINTDDIIMAIKAMQPNISLDAKTDDSGHNLQNMMPDISMNAEEQAERHLDRLLLRKEVSDILMPYPLWQRQILILHYGLDGRRPLSLCEIAKYRGCKYQWVQHSIKNAFETLRNNKTLKEYYDDVLN